MNLKVAPPLDEHVAIALEELIISGRWPGGARLGQDAIAAELGVSPTPVREAFRKLAARGFVELSPRRGAFVAHFSAANIVELLEVRIVLESAALRWAIPNVSASDIAAALAAIEELENAPDVGDWPELNWKFHCALYRPSNRPVLLELIEQLHSSARSRRLHRLITQDVVGSSKEHRRILSLVKKRDLRGALALLKIHIGVSSPQLKALLATIRN